MTNDLQQNISKELIKFYSLCLEKGTSNQECKDIAKELDGRYQGITPLLSEELHKYIAGLTNFYVNTGLPKMKDDELLEAIKYLEKTEP